MAQTYIIFSGPPIPSARISCRVFTHFPLKAFIFAADYDICVIALPVLKSTMMMKTYYSCMLIVLALCSNIPLHAQNGGGVTPPGGKPFIVVIDPGHGGVDPGARGSYSTEKQVALGVGLKLGKLIEQLPNVNVVYTRTTDMLPGGGTDVKAALRYRASMANKVGGNVFISIHCNSAPAIRQRHFAGYRTVYRRVHGKRVKHRVRHYTYTRTPNPAKGTEVYVWGVNKNDDKGVALRENAPLLNDPEYRSLFDSSGSAVNEIFWNTVRHEYMRQSLALAADVETQFAKINRIDREVKQRQVGIWVLHATAMPSILVETGFISNPEEEKYLNDDQDEIASCIYKAFINYLASVRGESQSTILAGAESPAAVPSNLTYKIQLLVSEHKYDTDDDRLFGKFDDKVSRETISDNGATVYRYMLGAYKTNQEALQRLGRVKLMGYKDAFIVTYQDKNRLD